MSFDFVDPFTLETLKTLLHEHEKSKKQFIVAKVNTETSTFYYSAHSLNKLIFRKNSDFLFRLYVLDPMTNTEIINAITYYILSPKVEKQKELRKEESFHITKRSCSVSINNIHFKENCKHPSIAEFTQTNEKILENGKVVVRRKSKSMASVQHENETEIDVDGEVYMLKCIGTDDDYLISEKLRKTFEQNALNVDESSLLEIQMDVLEREGIVLEQFEKRLIGRKTKILAFAIGGIGAVFAIGVLTYLLVHTFI